MEWLLIGLPFGYFLVRFLWKAYTHPSHVLGRQAANMNWIATGRVDDGKGYKNVQLSRGDLKAEISFTQGNVRLIKPVHHEPFADFIQLEHWLVESKEKTTSHKISLPSKEELEVKHAALREYAEILAVEVEQKASMLANALIEENSEMMAEANLAMTGKEEAGDMLVEAMNMHIHERCIYLMLGLVGMRRSKGKKTYITGIEFKTLVEVTFKKLVRISATSLKMIQGSEKIDAKSLTKNILDEISQVRKAITSYCVAKGANSPEPESALVEWFESNSGLAIRGNPLIAQTLNHEE